MSGPLATLRRTARRVTREQMRQGREWYPNARRDVANLLLERDFDTDEELVERACYVLAALSPRVTFQQNLRMLGRFLDVVALHSRPPSMDDMRSDVRGLSVSLASAVKTWSTGILPKGPKVRAFALAVASGGKADCEPVLDTWAFRAAGLDPQPSVSERRACVHAYRRVAKQCGDDVHTIQAACWIQARGSHV